MVIVDMRKVDVTWVFADDYKTYMDDRMIEMMSVLKACIMTKGK